MFTKILCFLFLLHLVAESLPISSSGHLRLLVQLFGDAQIVNFFSLSNCESILHGPSVIILTLFLKRRWLLMLKHPWRARASLMWLLTLGVCAEIPTVICYFFFKSCAITISLWFGFAISALAALSLIKSDRAGRQGMTIIKPWQAFVIGCIQGVSLLPGISRLGSTYSMGRWLGLAPSTSFMFSLTIEWPLIMVAFLKSMCDNDLPCMVGGLLPLCLFVGGIISYFTLWMTYRMALQGTWWHFGIYLIVPCFISFFF